MYKTRLRDLGLKKSSKAALQRQQQQLRSNIEETSSRSSNDEDSFELQCLVPIAKTYAAYAPRKEVYAVTILCAMSTKQTLAGYFILCPSLAEGLLLIRSTSSVRWRRRQPLAF